MKPLTAPGAVTALLRGGLDRLDVGGEREFLPAALEVLETPPSPLGRAVAMTIGLLFALALLWAFLGKVDVLTTAPGRVLPTGRTKTVQAPDTGVVRAIHVADGDRVAAGQILIELDQTQSGADRDRLVQDVIQARLDVARLTALKTSAETRRAPGGIAAPVGASVEQVEQSRVALRAAADEQGAKLAGLDQQIGEKRAEAGETAAQIAKTNASLPTLSEKSRLHQKLRDQGFGTSFAALDARQQLTDAKNDLVILAARQAQARASAAALERQRAQAASGFAGNVLADLVKAQGRLNETTQDLVKARQRSAETLLRAPTSGVVEDLAVHTLGAVVSAGQRLAMVVPDDQRLMVEARIPNRDVGFIHPGQRVAVKIETFNFTRYGSIRGRVIEVSRDAVPARDPSADDTGSPTGSQGPPGESPSYAVRISLERSNMVVDGRVSPLIAGMAATAEIRTGSRTIIDYLLSPLTRKTSEALHER